MKIWLKRGLLFCLLAALFCTGVLAADSASGICNPVSLAEGYTLQAAGEPVDVAGTSVFPGVQEVSVVCDNPVPGENLLLVQTQEGGQTEENLVYIDQQTDSANFAIRPAQLLGGQTYYVYVSNATGKTLVGTFSYYNPFKGSVTGTYAASKKQKGTFVFTIKAISGAQYRMDDGVWQDSNVFDGIEAYTTHTFYVRMIADGSVGTYGPIEIVDEKAEKANASAVDKLIKKLPAPEKLKYKNGSDVDTAQERFNCLRPSEQARIPESSVEKLRACAEQMVIVRAKAKEQEEKVNLFREAMASVPEAKAPVSSADSAAIAAAKDAYALITDKDMQSLPDVKALYKQLTAVEKTFQKNEAAGKKVESLFEKIKVDSVNELELRHRKTVEAAQKALEKLGTDDKKSFVNPTVREKIASYSERMEILADNEALIKAAEKAVKAVPKAEKIKFSDSAKLQKAEAAVKAVKDREEKLHEQPELQEIKLNITGEEDYLAAKEAYAAHVQTAKEYIRDYLDKLPAVAEDVQLTDAENITAARNFYKTGLSKTQQGFVAKEQLNRLTACEKQLKKVQAQDKKDKTAAEKVVKQIFKLPDVANGEEVTKKHASAIKSARKAYDALKTDAAIAYVQSISQQEPYNRDALVYLEACEDALKKLG